MLEKDVLWQVRGHFLLASGDSLSQQEVITKAGGCLSSCHTAQDVLVTDTPEGALPAAAAAVHSVPSPSSQGQRL